MSRFSLTTGIWGCYETTSYFSGVVPKSFMREIISVQCEDLITVARCCRRLGSLCLLSFFYL